MLEVGYNDTVRLLSKGVMRCCWTRTSGMLMGYLTSLHSLDISGISIDRRLTFANVPTKAKTRPALVHFSRVLLLLPTHHTTRAVKFLPRSSGRHFIG